MYFYKNFRPYWRISVLMEKKKEKKLVYTFTFQSLDSNLMSLAESPGAWKNDKLRVTARSLAEDIVYTLSLSRLALVV